MGDARPVPTTRGGWQPATVHRFDGAGAGRPLLVLTCWLLGGIALFLVGKRIARPEGADRTAQTATFLDPTSTS